MEYKGMRVVQSRNGNVVVNGKNGEMFIITHKGYLNDEQMKELVDKNIHLPESTSEE